jgi:hypothetical protein
MFNERRVTLKSRAQVEKMAVAGSLVADVLDRMAAESGRAWPPSSSTASPRS